MHPPIQTFNIVPKLPPALEPLREIVYNLWWSWEPAARRLFYRLDETLWEQTNHNPLRVLQLSRQARLEEVAQDESFLRELSRLHKQYKAYMAREDTYGRLRAKAAGAKEKGNDLIAYFSAEFGFHESVPNYSGGLGILAGDHCKSASDLDLNFCAVGLLYRHGYFKQQINREGLQEAVQLNQNFYNLPVQEIPGRGTRAEPLKVAVEKLPGRLVYAKVWQSGHRAHQPVPARHGHPGEQRRGPRHHRPALRRGPGDAHPAGTRPGHGRPPRPGGPGPQALPSTT